MNKSDVLLADISRIAHDLNQNALSEDEYIAAGGRYRADEFDQWLGGFNSALQLCGLKIRRK